jgi:hypothetical protein
MVVLLDVRDPSLMLRVPSRAITIYRDSSRCNPFFGKEVVSPDRGR